MGRRVRVTAGYLVALPNGHEYTGNAITPVEVVLSDEQWAKVKASVITKGILIDLGAAVSPDDNDGHLQSPDGTVYTVSVANGGAATATPV